MQTPDEFAHFFRSYNVSDGYCVAPRLTMVPHMVEEVAMAFPPRVETVRRLRADDILRYLREPLSEAQPRGLLNESINLYHCISYTPAAVGIRAGRLFSVPPAGLLYLARFSNLLVYLAFVYLAMRQLPDFHLPLLCVALLPMALNQASSASCDAVVFASALFLCCYLVRLIWDARLGLIDLRHYGILAAAIIVASLSKTNVWLVGLIILAPASRFRNARQRWAVVLGCFVLAAVVLAGWNYVNRQNTAAWIEHNRVQLEVQFADNVAALYQHPWMLLQAFGRTWRDRWPEFAAQFVGKFGWLSVSLHVWVIWVYCILLGLVALTGAAEIRVTIVQRLVFLGVVAAGVTAIFMAMWCANTPKSYNEAVLSGVGHIPGVQGRYFIPFAFPLLLALSMTRLRVSRKGLLVLATVTIFTVNAAALYTIQNTFYALT